MDKNIFEYRDYKTFLNEWIQSRPRRGHGLKSKIAKAAGCNTAYITQVLRGSAHFSAEQAEQLSHFLSLNKNEVHFFLQLIQLARAGTPSLRQLIQRQVDQASEGHFNLRNRLNYQKALSDDDQATYYSAWYYSAIHVVLSMKRLQTREALARYFGLPEKVVADVLEFLTSRGLAALNKGRYEVGSVSIHLGKDSPSILKHHTNWRIRAIDALEQRRDEQLHYSSVVTISKEAEPRIRSILIKAIEEVRAVVKASPEEGAYCYSVDLFCLEK